MGWKQTMRISDLKRKLNDERIEHATTRQLYNTMSSMNADMVPYILELQNSLTFQDQDISDFPLGKKTTQPLYKRIRTALASMCVLLEKGEDTAIYELITKLYTRDVMVNRSIVKLTNMAEETLLLIIESIARMQETEPEGMEGDS